MENLRWIILVVGLVVVLLIYLFGRNKNKNRQTDLPEPLSADEMPVISTHEEWEDIKPLKNDDEFVTSEINNFELNQELVEKVTASVDDVLPDVMTTGSVLKSQNRIKSDEPEVNQAEPESVETNEEYQDDLIILHVRAKSAFFSGSDLLKVINHQQLKFGDMNIYHAYDDSNAIIFSMSNMLEPGHFEPEQISEMRTPGVILFMQLSLVNGTEAALERMLHCADSLARELDANITTPDQQKLSEQSVESFKAKATYFK